MHKKLKRLPLPIEVHERLKAQKMETARDVLDIPEVDLIKKLDLTQPASRLRTKQEELAALTTTLTPLDDVLHGGIPCGSITEILGPPGAGKTQFCHLASILALATSIQELLESPTSRGSVLYFDTESAFSPERLLEIAASRFTILKSHEAELLKRVRIYSVKSSQELTAHLDNLETTVVETGARLVILDSIASIMRTEFDSSTLHLRHQTLSKTASVLKFIAETFSIPVLITNQITAMPVSISTKSAPVEVDETDESTIETPATEKKANAVRGDVVTAALGVSWAHCVNTRLVLEFTRGDKSGKLRQLTVAKSPMAPVVSFPYVITEQGLVLGSDEDSRRDPNNFWSGAVVPRAL